MLSENDREWVRAIVKAAVDETVLTLYKESRAQLNNHVKTCPNMLQSRALIIGIGIGVVLFAANGVVTLANTLLGIFGGS